MVALVCSIHLRYRTSVMVNWHLSRQGPYLLTSIMWPYHRLRFKAYWGNDNDNMIMITMTIMITITIMIIIRLRDHQVTSFFETDHYPGSGFWLGPMLKPDWLIVIRGFAFRLRQIYILAQGVYSLLLCVCNMKSQSRRQAGSLLIRT